MSSERARRGELLARLGKAGRDLSFQTVMFHQAVGDRLGLSATEMQCAGVLDAEGAMTAGRLAERTGLTTGAITGIVDRLEAAGLVRRSPDPSDRRRVIVAWVPERLADVGRYYEPMARAVGEFAGRLPDEQLALAVELVERMTAFTAEAASELRRGGEAEDARPRESTAPVGSVRAGRLELATGAQRLSIVGDPTLAALYRARFEGRTPQVRVTGGTIVVRYPHFNLRRSSAEIALNARVPWHLAVRGGASRVRGELQELALRGVEIGGGATDVVLELPSPATRVKIRIAGGAAQVTLRRPKGVPVRLEVHGGASRLALDAQRLGAVGGDAVLEAPGAERASGRYDIVVSGGASDLVVE